MGFILHQKCCRIYFVIRDYSSFFASFTESFSIKNLSLIFMHNISVLENIRLISNISFVRELGYSKTYKKKLTYLIKTMNRLYIYIYAFEFFIFFTYPFCFNKSSRPIFVKKGNLIFLSSIHYVYCYVMMERKYHND